MKEKVVKEEKTLVKIEDNPPQPEISQPKASKPKGQKQDKKANGVSNWSTFLTKQSPNKPTDPKSKNTEAVALDC